MINRRGFLGAILAAAAAPAIVKAGSLMRIDPRIVRFGYAENLSRSMRQMALTIEDFAITDQALNVGLGEKIGRDGNRILTISQITNKSLIILENDLVGFKLDNVRKPRRLL